MSGVLGDHVPKVWMIIQLADGTNLGYEIGPAEVEFRFDADEQEVSDPDQVFRSFRSVNRRWSWTITTFHGFRMYTPTPGNFSTDQPRLEARRPQLETPVPPAIDRTRE